MFDLHVKFIRNGHYVFSHENPSFGHKSQPADAYVCDRESFAYTFLISQAHKTGESP